MNFKILIFLQVLFITIISLFSLNIFINLSIQVLILIFWAKQISKNDQDNLSQQEDHQKKLETQAKLAALGEISAGIAHEINNPVAIVHGKAQLINLQVQEALESNQPINVEELQENNNDIMETVSRIDKIINSLRYFVRDDSRNPLVWAKVEEILDNVQVLSIDRCKKNGVLVKVNKQVDLATQIYCKPTQISQVIINLINNSFDALTQSNNKEKWIEIKCFDDSNNIYFQVIDSGPGLPAEAKEKILNSFYTSKATTKTSGMGIGLTIAKRIVEQHFGKIVLLDNQEHTTFQVVIPKGKM